MEFWSVQLPRKPVSNKEFRSLYFRGAAMLKQFLFFNHESEPQVEPQVSTTNPSPLNKMNK